ncbi:hypothetical protein MMC25_002285 [Agyrium rufum]|nr:hypothetical protein [Agyrium rufum]
MPEPQLSLLDARMASSHGLPPPTRKQSQEMVHDFSKGWLKSKPKSNLAQGLVKVSGNNVRKDSYVALWDGKEPISNDAQVSSLDLSLRSMIAAWKDFQGELPEDQRATRDSNPPTEVSLKSTIESLAAQCSSKKGEEYESAKVNFLGCCTTLDAHAQLFAIFPNGDKYVSLLSGTISSIVKAAVNYSAICEEFSIALNDIGGLMRYWNSQIGLYGNLEDDTPSSSLVSSSQPNKTRRKFENEYVVEIVVKIYTMLFAFLTRLMKKWLRTSSLKRAVRAFDQDFCARHIRKPMEDIKKRSAELVLETETLHRKESRRSNAELKRSNEEIIAMMQKQNETLRRLEEDRRNHDRRETTREQGFYDEPEKIIQTLKNLGKLQLITGDNANELLLQVVISETQPEEPSHATASQLLHPQSRLVASHSRSSSSSSMVPPPPKRVKAYAQAYLELVSRHIESYHPHNFPTIMLSIPGIQQTSSSIFQRLQGWLSDPGSEVLWVYGPATSQRPSTITISATHIVEMLKQANVPVIAYSCDRDDAEEDPFDELVRMVYSLIRQLVWLAPKNFKSTRTFDEERFALLNGKASSLDEALSLFRDLFEIVPRLLFCVIDGLDLLYLGTEDEINEEEDEEGTERHINRFFAILKKYKKSKDLKGLLVSDGFNHNLLSNTCDSSKNGCIDTVLDAMSSAKVRKGKKRRARRHLDQLEYASETGSSYGGSSDVEETEGD